MVEKGELSHVDFPAEAEFTYLEMEPPDYIVQSLLDITPDMLHELGATVLMFDVDDTIISDRLEDSGTIEEGVKTHLGELSLQFDLCFVTLSLRDSESMKAHLGRDYPVFGLTPLPEHLRTSAWPFASKDEHPELYFGSALEHFGIEPHEAVAIGNEIDADIIAPRSLGLKTILVDEYNQRRIEECLNEEEFMKKVFPAKLEKGRWTWRIGNPPRFYEGQ